MGKWACFAGFLKSDLSLEAHRHLHRLRPEKKDLASEQALVLGKKIARKGKGSGERACRQTFEATIPPSCNYLAEHLSVRSLSVNQFRA